ncbi:hypothetical protein C3405_06715 [Aeromonas hydrophila]|nr:hypothetical protein C2U40_18565 [Aeromonas sp. ASNIH4]POU40372.1 hypothetical protein C3405_06715 [Aeromonas hydrophila]POV89688.1 hypothetical protein C3395_06620 [Aeromonas sp. ASNIH6]
MQFPDNISEWKTDSDFTSAVKKLSEDDRKLLQGYMVSTVMSEAFGGKGVPEGQTIGAAIEVQRSMIEAKAREKQEKAAKQVQAQRAQEDALSKMNNAVDAVLLTFKFTPSDVGAKRYSDSFDISIGFRNKTDKEISGVKGIVIFKDMFGEIIKTVRLSNDQPIPAKCKSIYRGSIDYNQFMDADTKLRSVDHKKMKFEWTPEIYIFDDGSKLEAAAL